MRISYLVALGATLSFAAPASAQDGGDTPPPPSDPYSGTAFDGDYLSVGVGVGLGPSYDGSDDYVIFPGPIVQGSLGGVDFSPRAAGLAFDFVPDGDGPVGFDGGFSARLRSNRASGIEDEVVKSLGKLDRAFEIGPTAGVSVSGVLNPYDSLSARMDVRWDVAGAHDGMVVDPGISYFTPLSRGMAAQLSFSAEYGDSDFMDYYYSLTPAQAEASGLPAFEPDGGGFTKAGTTLLLGIDADGDLANGGLAFVVIGGYSRMLGDAKDTPFTSVRGSADQFLGAVGVGYTF